MKGAYTDICIYTGWSVRIGTKTMREVLSTARGRRPRTEFKTKGAVCFFHFLPKFLFSNWEKEKGKKDMTFTVYVWWKASSPE